MPSGRIMQRYAIIWHYRLLQRSLRCPVAAQATPLDTKFAILFVCVVGFDPLAIWAVWFADAEVRLKPGTLELEGEAGMVFKGLTRAS